MINGYMGTNIEGSPDLQTSVADAEILTSGNRYYNFSLLNYSDCHISINGSSYIFIKANQGIQIDVINSCKIQESSINFNWIAVRA